MAKRRTVQRSAEKATETRAAARRLAHDERAALGKFVEIFASVFDNGVGSAGGGGRGGHGAAQSSRLRQDYNRAVGSGDYVNELDREAVVRFSRHMDMNSIHFPLFIDRYVDLVIGKGLMPRAPGDSAAIRAVEMFERWARRDADHKRIRSYQQLQRLWQREALIAGDYGRIRTTEETIQGVESERIGARFRTASDDNKDGYVTDGVEVDKEGRPKRYWISPWQWRSPITTQQETAVDVRNFSLVAHRKRDTVRGMPLMANALEAIARLEETHVAVNIAIKLAALLSVFISSESPGAMRTSLKTGSETGTNNETGSTTIRDTAQLGPGGIALLKPNESVETVQGAQPSTGYKDYEELSLGLIAACVGIPVEMALLSVANSNFSTAKLAKLLAEDTAEPVREEFVRQQCWVDYEWFVARQVASGALPGPIGQYFEKVTWTKPVIRVGDPLVEAKTRQIEIEQNFRSKDDVVLENYGGDPDQVAIDRQREKQREAEMGIVPPTTPGAVTDAGKAGEQDSPQRRGGAEEGKGKGDDAGSED